MSLAAKPSTAFSDLVLAASAVWSLSQLNTRTSVDYQFCKWWFYLQAIAASLGVLKFGRCNKILSRYEEYIGKYHRNFSWLAFALGIPCLGAQFCILHGFILLSQLFLGSAVLSFVICTRRPELKDKVPRAISVFVILVFIFLGVADRNWSLLLAACLFILSSVIGDEGTVGNSDLPRVDVFHYVLVAVNYLLVRALLHVPNT